MAKKKETEKIGGRLNRILTEAFASTWTLLSDTGTYLSRTSLFPHYENELRTLRRSLENARYDSDKQKLVRAQISFLRKSLREAGHDLSLASYSLAIKGSRNDAALSEGFRRLVLYVGTRQIYPLAGEANHVELYGILENRMAVLSKGGEGQCHFLWFRWVGRLLELSGSDSESADSFETFKEYCEIPENRLRILASMKSVR
jgi:hypothetical protein